MRYYNKIILCTYQMQNADEHHSYLHYKILQCFMKIIISSMMNALYTKLRYQLIIRERKSDQQFEFLSVKMATINYIATSRKHPEGCGYFSEVVATIVNGKFWRDWTFAFGICVYSFWKLVLYFYLSLYLSLSLPFLLSSSSFSLHQIIGQGGWENCMNIFLYNVHVTCQNWIIY